MEKVKAAKKIIMIVWIAFFLIFGVCLACTTVVPEYYENRWWAIAGDDNYRYNDDCYWAAWRCNICLERAQTNSSDSQYMATLRENFDKCCEELDDLIASKGIDEPISYKNKAFSTADIEYYTELEARFDGRIKNEKQQADAFLDKSNNIRNAMRIPAWITGVIFGILTIAFIVLTILSKKGNKQQL